MLKIGDFSKLSRVSIRMLRHYDEIGLLSPAFTDPATGYRYYREDQLPAVGRIAALREMGFGLAAIGQALACWEDRARLDGLLQARRAELLNQLEETAVRLRLLDTAMERLRKEESMNYDVTVKTLPQRYVASVRMTIPSYAQEGLLWEILGRETEHLALVPASPCCCSVTYHDGEYREADVEVEAQKTVKGSYPDTGHVKFKTVPGVTFASATFRGDYSQIPQVNAAVAAWVEANGYCFDGPMFNLYHVTPHDTRDPGEYVTEVCYPVRGK